MAFSELYINPSVGGPGAGTLLDPHASVEFAIINNTFDTSNGTRLNLHSGTDDVLAANIAAAFADTSESIAWAPGEFTPCVIQGYTDIANDGTQGGISGGGAVPIFQDNAQDAVKFVDMHLHNVGSNEIIDLDNWIAIINCEFNNWNGNAQALNIDTGIIHGCYFHGNGGNATVIQLGGSTVMVQYCYFDLDATVISAIAGGDACHMHRNIIILPASDDADGIVVDARGTAMHNSIYSKGSGTGIGIRSQNSELAGAINNNLVEGFSGVGGIGIDLGGTNSTTEIYLGNAVFNCTTAYGSAGGYAPLLSADNETLTVSPFTDAANGDFSPVDTGNLKEGSLPAAWTN